MGLMHETEKEAAADRALQKALVIALDAQRSSLRRDECSAWRINGKHGHVYTWGPRGGWLICCAAGTPKKWTNLKSRLSFCKVTQDGDDEGCLRLTDLPTAEQAILIRKALGLKQKRTANVGSFRSTAQEGFSGPKPREEDGGGTFLPVESVDHFAAENEPLAEAAE